MAKLKSIQIIPDFKRRGKIGLLVLIVKLIRNDLVYLFILFRFSILFHLPWSAPFILPECEITSYLCAILSEPNLTNDTLSVLKNEFNSSTFIKFSKRCNYFPEFEPLHYENLGKSLAKFTVLALATVTKICLFPPHQIIEQKRIIFATSTSLLSNQITIC